MANAGALTIQEAVDRIGFGRFQKLLLAVCGVTWAADAAEVLLLGFALPSIIGEFGISAAEGGLIATAPFARMLVGAWFWGTISDYVGRRAGFQLTVLIFAIFGLLSPRRVSEGGIRPKPAPQISHPHARFGFRCASSITCARRCARSITCARRCARSITCARLTGPARGKGKTREIASVRALL
jgi:hypothetical protein